MENEDEHVNTLLMMGFPDAHDIRRALRLAKYDLNEAVSILTNEQSVTSYPLEGSEEKNDAVTLRARNEKSPCSPAPPSYDEVVETERKNAEFPVTNLYELESRVFVDSWSIPYKKEESLGKCLLAATELAREGLCEADENCKRFMERCMPEAFKKLLTSAAVRRWGPEIQEGIFNMLEILVDLVVARLKYGSVPEFLLSTSLAMAFDPECEWHLKNKSRRWNLLHWEETFGGSSKVFASSPSANLFKDPNGWLVDLINTFAHQGGFEQIQLRFDDEDLQDSAMSALLKPLALCAEYFNKSVVCPLLSPCMDRAISFVRSLQHCDLKHKKMSSISDLLCSMKLLCVHLWPQRVEMINSLRLEIIIRMLRSPHFNSRMNGLKEVTKLIDELSDTKNNKAAIEAEALLDWISQSKLLSIALEGNIDHVQYTDRLKAIVEFVGPRLSLDELTKIWKMQVDQNSQVVDNIYAIMAAASAKFNAQQFDHLFTLIQKNWQEENIGMREKLLTLIGKIGREARPGKTSTKVLDLLWDLAHLPSLPTPLIEQSLDEHLSILNDAAFKDQVRKIYIVKCIEDIKKSCCVLPALRQLHNIALTIAKPSIHKHDKAALSELNKTHEVVKLLTTSLAKCHKNLTTLAGDNKAEMADVLVDGRYTHRDFVNCHLHFLQFMLQEGDLYLSWNRCKDIWDTLVSNPDACQFDHEMCFDWFSQCLEDLEPDTRSQMFQQKLLKMDPALLTMKAFHCFKIFFESVNLEERKLKRVANFIVVDKLDPIGIDFLWQVVLYAQNEDIADIAIDNILDFSYLSLAPRLKKDSVTLHKKFISDCSKRLEDCFSDPIKSDVGGFGETAMMTLSGSAMSTAVSSATKTLTAMSVAEVASFPLPSRSVQLQNIRRLLMVAERYVSTIEEMHSAPRTILPHGASFQGHPITIHVSTCEGTKQEFTLISHSNETLGSIRANIGQRMKLNVENIQLASNDKILVSSKDSKLLGQLEFADEQNLVAKVNTIGTSVNAQVKEIDGATNLPEDDSASLASNRQSYNFEQEKMLPGVVMASGGQVFDMLYQLTELEDSKITSCVRNLLRLIPTDPSIQDALDSLGSKDFSNPNSNVDVSPRTSPCFSPKKPNIGNKEKESKSNGIKSLLDAHAVSPFRVLYNLEVLSSKLMPTTCDGGTQQSARIFCQEFLNVGGLRLVINILQKDAMPLEVDYDTRQGCYFMALQLARFLLCGQTITGDNSLQTEDSAQVATEKTNVFFPPLANKAIQTLCIADFTDTVVCLTRVAWAAAAGQLHLTNSTHHPSSTILGAGTRQNSSSSNTSSGSDGGETQTLHAGVCSQQTRVGPRDSLIAREALELLVTCLHLRKDNITVFYNLTCVGDFVIDTVLGSPNIEIRNKACQQFSRLSTVVVSDVEDVVNPHHFLLKIVLNAHLPLWVPSSNARGSNQRLLAQCWQYFELVCRLLKGLTAVDQQSLQINPVQMIEDEIAWLSNFTPSDNADLKSVDNILLAGHLRLIQILLTCEGVDKKQFGPLIITDLLNQFLFPASWVISKKRSCNSNSNETSASSNPKCSGTEARVSAYNLLQELALNCGENMKQISEQLVHLHHRFIPDLAKEFEHEPAVISRPSCGFVGLKNAGATCYMNSVIQELFLVPGIREAILSMDDENTNEDSVFYQFQSVFGHLLDSQLQYYIPANFWKCFKLWGQPVNVREQQDAFEFFMHLIDQVDEHLKANGRDQIFKNTFEGLFSNQMICQECPHRYEREESFMALNVTVKSHNLQESLDQFVRGELLEGDNAYFCEKCSEKRNTIKRTCIKKLSLALVIHLKRFDYDWEANRALKFDDHFKFPWILDMGPYMVDGVQDKEKKLPVGELTVSEKIANGTLYELVGIVVHSGQANAGHYYSFIKDRRSEANLSKGKWYKFNDTSVEEFEMNEASLEAECFGGTYRAKVYDPSSSYPEIRQRYWNGYMLFYERMDDTSKGPWTPRRISTRRSPLPLKSDITSKESDGLMQLTELVHHGDREGIFQNKMPTRIQQNVHQANLHFMQNRDVYCDEYFQFVYDLVRCNEIAFTKSNKDEFAVLSVKLAINFLLNTYFRTKMKDITVVNMWSSTMASLLTKSEDATFWLLEFFSNEAGLAYIKSFLLECPNKDVRIAFSHILQKLLESYFKCNLDTPNKNTDDLMEYLLSLLNKDVPDNCRTCSQYFDLLCACAQMGRKACAHLFKHSGFKCLLVFLLGPSAFSAKHDEILSRRWTSYQAREFSALHKTMALMVLICDVTPYRTCSMDDQSNSSSSLLPLPDDMHLALFGPRAHQYIHEVIIACRESSSALTSITDMLLQCSLCNQTFSTLVLQQIMLQCSTVPSSELKNIFQLLLDLLVLDDPLQFTRLQFVIDGFTDKNSVHYEGILAIIKSNHSTDSCRSYQCIKFLVHLANRCSLAKDYVMQSPSRWQWAVNWLRKKMSEHTYWNPQSIPLSNEDSNSHSFQRTISAQDTLAEATALLSEVDEMETDHFEDENK